MDPIIDHIEQNIVKDAINQILFRTEGNDKYPLHRLEMLKSNIRLMYPKVAILLLLITCLVFSILLIVNEIAGVRSNF